MEGTTSPLNRIGKKLGSWLNAGFSAMARYPYDLDEMPWTLDVERDVAAPRVATRLERRTDHRNGRTIKLMPPPASQRYQDEKPRRVSLDEHGRPDASVNAR